MNTNSHQIIEQELSQEKMRQIRGGIYVSPYDAARIREINAEIQKKLAAMQNLHELSLIPPAGGDYPVSPDNSASQP